MTDPVQALSYVLGLVESVQLFLQWDQKHQQMKSKGQACHGSLLQRNESKLYVEI